VADLTFAEMKEQAFEQFLLYAEPCCDPSIEGLELSILSRHMRASIWLPNTAYVLGDVIQTYPRSGYRYGCIVSGSSGALVWPTPYTSSWSFTDGTVVWRECGSDYENVFDVRAAVHEAWTIKASRSSHLVTTATSGSSVQASLLHQQCRARAIEFAPLDL
jgi:hypothetical protein